MPKDPKASVLQLHVKEPGGFLHMAGPEAGKRGDGPSWTPGRAEEELAAALCGVRRAAVK